MMFEQSFTDAAANPVLTQVAYSTVIVTLLQLLKKAAWFPWLTEQSKNVSRLFAAFLSMCAGVGIHATWSHTNGTLLITGLSFYAILGFFGAWLKSHCVQEGIYRLYQATQNAGVDPKVLAQAVQMALRAGADELKATSGAASASK